MFASFIRCTVNALTFTLPVKLPAHPIIIKIRSCLPQHRCLHIKSIENIGSTDSEYPNSIFITMNYSKFIPYKTVLKTRSVLHNFNGDSQLPESVYRRWLCLIRYPEFDESGSG